MIIHKIPSLLLAFLLTLMCGGNACYAATEAANGSVKFNDDWHFTFGDASSPAADFGCGTEYFNYLTKAAGIHNAGPYSPKFKEDGSWTTVRLPHDWVVNLPFAPEASHSHGYHTVGYKYPKTSVGWYRKTFHVDKELEGQYVELRFDGIFRDATVWVNGVYMGREHSGYASQVYDITDYLNYGGDNLITVRADASLEEGWFYEGGGIYRNVWLRTVNPVHVKTFGTFAYAKVKKPYAMGMLTIESDIANTASSIVNSASMDVACYVSQELFDAKGEFVVASVTEPLLIRPKETKHLKQQMVVSNPHLWSIDDPYLYNIKTTIKDRNGVILSEYTTKTGIREVEFDMERGFSLNGKNIKLKGVNMHQDMAGVGSAIPDVLQVYIAKRLKSLGCNAYRASHNPMSPAMLDVCDSLGILVIDENRLMGVNKEHIDLMGRMIERDRNHPSVILWSTGNEEWGLENNIQGTRIAASMRDYAKLLDPTRNSCAANAGGTELIKGLDVVGYNYIVQNDVENRHAQHPEWKIVGTEETTACGTRGVYFPDSLKATMPSINRTDTTYENIIERGWKFYNSKPWAAGLFYWTGFDYRGEPNPLGFPAVGSQFGILDYCGFEKDEAYYLRSWWKQQSGSTTDAPSTATASTSAASTNSPTERELHIFPHWNLEGHEGDTISLWAYSNYEEIELYANGKNLGRKAMPKDGHLTWDAVYKPGKLRAVCYMGGKKVREEIILTADTVQQIALIPSFPSLKEGSDTTYLKADNEDLCVIKIELRDAKGNLTPTACRDIEITVDGPARILGVGNGSSSFMDPEHPAELNCKTFRVKTFNGLAMVIIQSTENKGKATVTCKSEWLQDATLPISVQ